MIEIRSYCSCCTLQARFETLNSGGRLICPTLEATRKYTGVGVHIFAKLHRLTVYLYEGEGFTWKNEL